MSQSKASIQKTRVQKPVLRSPLKDKTLRNPGQSIEDDIANQTDSFMEGLIMVLISGAMLFVALYQWLFPSPALTMVWVTGFYFAAALAFFLFRLFRTFPKLKRLRRARDGERAVAEYLDTLREGGHRVFHDIVGTGFNIDHVIIGPKGIFTLETKTLSKREGQNDTLRFDGKAVHVGRAVLPDNPVPQALAQVTWLKRTLLESTGKTFAVKPAVLFPGWFVEPYAHGSVHDSVHGEVWVLEPKALKGFLEREPVRMKPEDITLAAFHLKRYIRTTTT